MSSEIREELARILEDVGAKTGVKVRLQPPDQERGYPFSLDFCGGTFSAWLECGEDAKHMAALVRCLVSYAERGHTVRRKEEYLKSILGGEGGREDARQFALKYRLPERRECCVISIVPERRVEEAERHIASCLETDSDMCLQLNAHIAVVKFLGDGQTATEFGEFLVQSLYEEVGTTATAGIGSSVPFEEVASSFAQAETAVRVSTLFHASGRVHTYREFLLIKMLEDVPVERLREYMRQFNIGDSDSIFDDEEMVATAEEYLNNSLNISEASRNLYLHRNTLMYRLDKIERITGLNIRNFPDAVTFRVISIIYRLLHQ